MNIEDIIKLVEYLVESRMEEQNKKMDELIEVVQNIYYELSMMNRVIKTDDEKLPF